MVNHMHLQSCVKHVPLDVYPWTRASLDVIQSHSLYRTHFSVYHVPTNCLPISLYTAAPSDLPLNWHEHVKFPNSLHKSRLSPNRLYSFTWGIMNTAQILLNRSGSLLQTYQPLTLKDNMSYFVHGTLRLLFVSSQPSSTSLAVSNF